MSFAKLPQPCLRYVFDGKPPHLKKQELAKRYISDGFFFFFGYFFWTCVEDHKCLITMIFKWCTLSYRHSKRADATEDLNKALVVKWIFHVKHSIIALTVFSIISLFPFLFSFCYNLLFALFLHEKCHAMCFHFHCRLAIRNRLRNSVNEQ